jgi:hypothetical protein
VARFPFTRDGWRRAVRGRTRRGGGTKVVVVVGGGVGRLGMSSSVPVGWNGPQGSRNVAGLIAAVSLKEKDSVSKWREENLGCRFDFEI